MTKFLLATAAVMALSGCADQWEGFVYPDKDNLSKHFTIGKYSTLAECGRAARTALMQGRENGIALGDYECGLNCKPMAGDPTMMLCEKTER